MTADNDPKSPALPSEPLVDGVVVINLDARPDRLERFRAQAATVAALRGWVRIPAVRGIDLPGYGQPPWFRGRSRDKSWAGRAGCVLSHRKAIEHARREGWRRVLILEDDVEFGAELADFLAAHGGTLLAAAATWDVCYLGFTQPVTPIRLLRRFPGAGAHYAVHGCYTTHAYILQDTTYAWLLERLPTQERIWAWLSRHRAVDRWYIRHLSRRFRVTALSPTLIGQFSDFSDIGQREPGADRAQHLHTRVDASRVAESRLHYRIGKWLRDQQFRVAAAWDALRGLRKRLRGF